ncbi:glycosyltransferase family 4 protein [Verminephrobacter aporrectodeae]|uniref:Glycosyl transferase n=1 Tax=Verminephrobacter aporrectodeae subsp. tuberculatae TaxID=1110392 RepID=A0ABT3KUQ1_9BURK|nr:glycosyltransferase [Verminephrobacter aporrectodeae]MCW5222998.1 glycosyl transferase [Verminephrobacter aporrectodeae subsp. tuberculatae]MCW5256786.1 glycosyl transferase [Verminephrobacter aporrectodeae subsp. tuberculatae]MCW5288462.1 glycosyl transferase [Verminephrobacter aporrectodeae subsp. tuberculatae]MCW5322043.1 glycosyl transferase [Verminephrobacter aporrectodeae subsp. tuberculatae]MCW8167219.1 glycosyl transferase [Verminephrobacter aporrectodeae subsp. tuberculatae]
MIWLSVVGFLVAALAAALIVRWGREHAMAYGNAMPQRFHLGDIPRLGGAALLAGMAVGWGLGVWQSCQGDPGSLRLGPWVGNWLLVLLPAALGGIAEDMTQRLPVRYRLALTGASGALAVLLLDLALPRLGWPWLDTMLRAAPWLGAAIAMLAVTGLPHAFNIIDGYNGLAGMVALILCLALAHVALQVGDRALAALLVSTAAATAGFLIWNYPRGMLFAGDGGAYVWGVVIALASISLVQRNPAVSPWFPMLLLIYPVWETVFSIYRKAVRGVSPGVADALHFHQLIYRRIVRGVFHDDESRRVLMRNNRTSPYLWGFTLLTVVPAILFWNNTPRLMGFCGLFVVSYVLAYLAIVRFKVPQWLRR